MTERAGCVLVAQCSFHKVAIILFKIFSCGMIYFIFYFVEIYFNLSHSNLSYLLETRSQITTHTSKEFILPYADPNARRLLLPKPIGFSLTPLHQIHPLTAFISKFHTSLASIRRSSRYARLLPGRLCAPREKGWIASLRSPMNLESGVFGSQRSGPKWVRE